MNSARLSACRDLVLDDLAAKIGTVALERPLRIAIDGRTAAGKTTLSDELAALVSRRGRPVIRTSIDGFHRPKAERYARGRYSAEGYYYDARDLAGAVARARQCRPDRRRHLSAASRTARRFRPDDLHGDVGACGGSARCPTRRRTIRRRGSRAATLCGTLRRRV